MSDAFRVVIDALRDFWDGLFQLVLMNVLTTLLAIPIVTFPPALAGLWHVGNQVARGDTANWSDYFTGFRRYFWKAWGVALVNILAAVIVATNVWFYTPGVGPLKISPILSLWLRGLWVGGAILWLMVQLYSPALLLEQEDQRLRVALRNAAVLLIRHPGFSVVLGILVAVAVVISVIFPPLGFLVLLAFLAVVSNEAVRHLLEQYRDSVNS